MRSRIILLCSILLSVHCLADKPEKTNQNIVTDTISAQYFIQTAEKLMFSKPDSAIYLSSQCNDFAIKNDLPGIQVKALRILGIVSSIKMELDTSDYYFSSAIKIASSKKENPTIAGIHKNIGINQAKRGNNTKAIQHYINALKIYQKLNDSINTFNTYSNIGLAYSSQGKYDSAMINYHIALEYSKNLSPPNGNILLNLGGLYIHNDDYNRAEKYLLQAMEIYSQQNDLRGKLLSLTNLGIVYTKTGNYDNALKTYSDAEKTANETGLLNKLASIYNNTGEVYFLQKNYNKSIDMLKKSIAIKEQHGDSIGLMFSYNSIATNYILLSNFNKAKVFATQSLSIAKNKGILKGQLEAYENLSEIAFKSNDYMNAYLMHVKYKELSDSVFNNEKFQTIQEINAKYETEKKDLEIEQNKLKLKNQKITIYSILVISILLIAGFIISYKMRLKKLNANIELYKRNQELAKLKTENKLLAKRNGLSDEKTTDIIEKLNQILEGEKIYKSPDLTITKLAEILNTNREYLSQILNQSLGLTFSDYINYYRIEEAKIILEQDAKKKSHHLTMLAIANKVGFKNTSTFNPTFKKYTGLTPSEYKVAGGSV